jgi:O-antigen/teichoic acid export membrane protein
VTLLGLWATPQIIRSVGDAHFGAYKIMQEYLGYLGLIEMGLYGSLLIVFLKNNNETHSSRSVIYRVGAKKYLILVLFYFLAGLILFYPVAKSLKLSLNTDIFSSEYFISYFLLLLGGLFIPLNILRAELDSKMRSDVLSISQTIQSFAQTLLTLFLVTLGGGIVQMSIATLTSYIVPIVIYQYMLKRSLYTIIREMVYGAIKNSHEIQNEIKAHQKSNLINELAGKVCLFTDNIIISFFFGPTMVTSFFISQRLAQIVQGFTQSFGNSTWAALGELYQENKMELMCKRILQLSKLIILLTISLLTPVFLVQKQFVQIWMGSKYYLGNWFTLVVCLNAFLLPILSFWGWIFTAIGKPKLLNRSMILQAFINLFLSIIFSIKFGMIGPILGTLFTYVFIAFSFTLYELKKLSLINVPQILMCFVKAFMCQLIVASFVLYFFNPDLIISSWSSLIFYFLFSLFVSITCSYLIILNSEEKSFYKDILSNRILKSFGLSKG